MAERLTRSRTTPEALSPEAQRRLATEMFDQVRKSASSGGLQAIVAEFERASKEGGAKFDMEVIKDKIYKTLVEELKLASKEGFAAMEDEGTKKAAVFDLLSKAAITANGKIISAMDAVRTQTQQMVRDMVTGFETMAESAEKFQRRGAAMQFFQRLLGDPALALQDPMQLRFTSPTKNRDVILRTLDQREGGAQLAGLIRSNTRLADGFTKFIADQSKTAPIGAAAPSGNALLTGFLQQAAKDPALKAALEESFGQIVDRRGARPDQKFSQTDINSGRALGSLVKGMLETAQEGFLKKTQAELQGTEPTAGTLRTAATLTGTPSGEAGKTPIEGLDKTNERLIEFKDALLDATLQLYDTIRKLSIEQSLATKFGLQFDRPGALGGAGRSILAQAESFTSSQ